MHIKHPGHGKHPANVIISALKVPTINQILICSGSFWASVEAK